MMMNLKNNLIPLIIVLIMAFAALPSLAEVPQHASVGMSWLLQDKLGNDYWGRKIPAGTYIDELTAEDVTPVAFRDTSQAAIALAIYNSNSLDYQNVLTWLQSANVKTTEYLSGKISVLAVAGSDVSVDLGTLLTYQNKNGDFGGYKSTPSNPLDTALALQALKAANYSDTTLIGQSLNHLIANQNTDGGWGLSANDTSSTYITSIVLRTLAAYNSVFINQNSINQASAFLLGHQNADGGFGSSPSNVYQTALSVMSLIESTPLESSSLKGQGYASAIQNAINFLTTAQFSNGSWNDDPYSTALALQALATARPNVTVSNISLSKPMPQEGEETTITVTIKNAGYETASNIAVRFYLGDPSTGSGQVPSGVQIGADQTIPSLTPNSSAPVSVTASFTGIGGKTIFVIVDPDNLISETSESDNKSSARIWVATGPDLAVYSEDLKPSTYVPVSGTPFTLGYKIRNLGESGTGAFSVSLYDGNPSAGSGQGTLLQSINISGLAGTEVRSGSVGVTLTGNGSHTLYLVADTGDTVTELSETNNTGSVTVNVGGTQSLADLSVSSMDITFIPSRPRAGDLVTISTIVRNFGTEAADNFTISIFDNAPEAGGTLIASESVSFLPAGGSHTMIAYWPIPEGIHTVYAVVDRANTIAEASESNNSASVRVMTDMVDISISAADLVFTPSNPVSNDPVVLFITARNTGIKETGAFNLALYNGDPTDGGALLETFPISNITDDGEVTLSYAFTAAPGTYRFHAVADTENVVTEMYEENNFAIRALRIKAPGEILGPDLMPTKIDLSSMTTDTQTLSAGGKAYVTFQNKGDDKITTPFTVLVFEDRDGDAAYTAGVDLSLGSSLVTYGTSTAPPALWPESAGTAAVPLAGTVAFLHSPLYALIDSGDAVREQDETNNILASCKDCETAPQSRIQLTKKWSWKKAFGSVFLPAVVPYFFDSNGDGEADEKDVPAVVFGWVNYSNANDTALVALRGDTGAVITSLKDPVRPLGIYPYPVVGDIDSDGKPEIITTRNMSTGSGPGLLAYDFDTAQNAFKLKWDNYQAVKNVMIATSPWNPPFTDYDAPVLADLDKNGSPEILMGVTMFNADGSVRTWASDYKYGSGAANFMGTTPIAADLDLDGTPDIVAGNTAYTYTVDANGVKDLKTKWWNTSLPDGINAVANFNDDPYPEVVLLTFQSGIYYLYLLDHNGKVLWGPVSLKNLEGAQISGFGGPPLIADFDGDGVPEIGVRGFNKYLVALSSGDLTKAPHFTRIMHQIRYSNKPAGLS